MEYLYNFLKTDLIIPNLDVSPIISSFFSFVSLQGRSFAFDKIIDIIGGFINTMVNTLNRLLKNIRSSVIIKSISIILVLY